MMIEKRAKNEFLFNTFSPREREREREIIIAKKIGLKKEQDILSIFKEGRD
ncbi:hypothetical protein [endosymbiont GvMRE of Glomus versiforme]|uniref:hypothetical protein n=1 Tax=endosymbiont GvMRE of Glomus versiforme TaxID=2039283 RepID=UPI001558E361|nr:hypothetical protein [endosymbiont GvMRE of Glomus versiforme]